LIRRSWQNHSICCRTVQVKIPFPTIVCSMISASRVAGNSQMQLFRVLMAVILSIFEQPPVTRAAGRGQRAEGSGQRAGAAGRRQKAEGSESKDPSCRISHGRFLLSEPRTKASAVENV
jgi:hypothetical protein